MDNACCWGEVAMVVCRWQCKCFGAFAEQFWCCSVCVQKVEAAALSRGAIDVRDTDARTLNVWNTNDAACCHC